MKAITLWQPWASLIAAGHKTIETRTHNRFAGLVGERIAIHAGTRYDPRTWAGTWGVPHYLGRMSALSISQIRDICYDCPKLPRGAVVCTAVVLEYRLLTRDDSDAALCSARGLCGLILGDIKQLADTVTVRGHQGIWSWQQEDEK